MDLVMRNLTTGEEQIVPYDFDFNIAADGQANFEVAMPIDAEVWDMFYVDNYTRDNEYVGFVTDISIQTAQNQKIVKGNTFRYYLWSSVALSAANVPSGDIGNSIWGYVFSSYLCFPGSILFSYVSDGSTHGAVEINRFDSCATIIDKMCASAGRVCIPRYARETDGTVGITFTVREPNIYYPRIDDGEVGGTGKATLDTALRRKVVVIAAGTGEGLDRTIKHVWYDGSTYTVEDNSDWNVPSDYEEYFLDYSNADDTELVKRAKEIALSFWTGSSDMTASELTITPGATIGDTVVLTGAVEHTTTITGMILRRTNGIVTEEFTYGSSDATPSVGSTPETTGLYAGSATKGGPATRTVAIPFGICDSTSTSTAFTASVPGIRSYYDGVAVWLKNGVVTSASGFTININGLGAKPVYTNLAAATAETTKFNVNYTMLFVYDSSRVAGGCWVCYNGYDSNTNTIGYQIRTNSSDLVAADKGYRYRIWLTSADGTKWVPINTSSATNATTARSLNTRKIDPFGEIVYRPANSTVESGASLGATGIWQQYTLTIGYSYVKTLTASKPVYLKCTPNDDGSATMADIVQALPSSSDGKIYIFLGVAYSTTAMELHAEHPVYYHDGTGIRIWTGETIVDVSSSLTAGSNVNIGSNCHAWKKGGLCFVTLNMQITGSISSGATLVSGLPTNSSAQVSFAAALGGTTSSAAMRIQSGASVITADGAISTTGWYDAFFVYVMG